jgi:CDP-6-deoxy-D-xylo-4-hexulose-3-dehydrase
MEGGLVVTDDLNLYETLLSLRAHGWTRDLSPKNSVHAKTGNDWDDLFRFVLPGYNLRPLELEGALGQSQLRKLPDFIDQRRKNAQKLISLSNQLEFMRFQKEFGDSSWFGFSIVLEGPLVGKRKQLVESLSDFGIETRPIVTGNFTRNPVMKHLNFEEIPSLPIADEIHENGFFVGNHHFDLGCEIDLLVELLVDFEEKHVK